MTPAEIIKCQESLFTLLGNQDESLSSHLLPSSASGCFEGTAYICSVVYSVLYCFPVNRKADRRKSPGKKIYFYEANPEFEHITPIYIPLAQFSHIVPHNPKGDRH